MTAVSANRLPEGAADRLHAAVRRIREATRDRPTEGRGHSEADDEVGTLGTDGALGFDPFPLLGALDRVGARTVVIGQVAGIMHGSVELTGDLDLLWDGDPGQIHALAAAFAAARCRLTDDDAAPLALGPDTFRLPKVQFFSTQISGDCCTPALPWGALPVGDFLQRALTATDRDGVRIRYLRREDLIAMRRAVGRPKDLRRAQELHHL